MIRTGAARRPTRPLNSARRSVIRGRPPNGTSTTSRPSGPFPRKSFAGRSQTRDGKGLQVIEHGDDSGQGSASGRGLRLANVDGVWESGRLGWPAP